MVPFNYTDLSEEVESKCEFMVLDGQQRLTSCYSALYNKGKSYFIDLNKLYELDKKGSDDIDFEEIIIHKKYDAYPDHRLKYNHMPLGFLRNRNNLRERLIPYKDSFRKDESKKDYLDFLELKLEKYLDSVIDYEFPVIILPKELALDAVCKVFQNINTTGLKLSAFDICVAKFTPQDIRLKQMITSAKNSDNVNIALKDDETTILQAIALLSDKHPKKNKLADTLVKDDIDSWWNPAVSGLDYAIRTLDNFGCGCCKNLSLLPYKPILPVIAALYVKSGYEDLAFLKQTDFEQKIKKYFYCSSLSARYTEGTDNKLYDDYHTIQKWMSGSKEPPIISKGIQWNLGEFMSLKTTGSNAIVKTILCIFNANNPKDFYSNEDVGVGSNTPDCDKHHIFPTAKYSLYNEKLINSIFNITFLVKDSNNHIKDKSTREYFQEILEVRKIGEDSGRAILKNHFINGQTYDAFIEERFEDFVKLRAEEIKEYLITNVGIRIHDVDVDQMDNNIAEEMEEDSDE